jgi:hydroxymethylbilane synthase
VQVRAADATTRAIVAALDHQATATAVKAERGFLAALEGGCQVPIGALAVNGELYGFISSVDGRQSLRDRIALDPEKPEACGKALADALRAKGAEKILAGLHRLERAPAPQPE